MKLTLSWTFSGGSTIKTSFSEATSNVSMLVALAIEGRPLMGAAVEEVLPATVVVGVVGVVVFAAVVTCGSTGP